MRTNRRRGGDWGLELSPMNEECLVGALHYSAPTASLSFVHTARRSYRLGCFGELFGPAAVRPRGSPANPNVWRKEKS